MLTVLGNTENTCLRQDKPKREPPTVRQVTEVKTEAEKHLSQNAVKISQANPMAVIP